MLRFSLVTLIVVLLLTAKLNDTATSQLTKGIDARASQFPLVMSPLDILPVPDARIILKAEGCTDTLVVPPFPSGPTISCGVDLSAIGKKNVVRLFSGLVPPRMIAEMLTASGLRGKAAQRWVDTHRTTVRLSSTVTSQVFRRALATMWGGVYRDRLNSVHPAVQTALLSYAYHTGHAPTSVGKLRDMSPSAVAELLRARGLSYRGSNSVLFRRRREMEAKYIERFCCYEKVADCNVLTPFGIPKT